MIQLQMSVEQRNALARCLREQHPLIAHAVEQGQLIDEDAKFLREILLKAPNSWFECDRYVILEQLC